MQLIDTHAHIYSSEFSEDRKVVVEKAEKEGVQKIFMPAIDSTTHAAMLEVEKTMDGCISMMGLHPCSVGQNVAHELAIIEDYLQSRTFCAVGEIGLDFYWDKTFMDQQYRAFEKQVQWAINYSLPIVIHSRNAMDECITVVKKYPAVKGVFHCFSGTVAQAEQIIELGFFLGIGGVLTYKNAGLDKVLEKVGTDHLVLETDAPYLAPVPFRGKRNEPAYLLHIAQKISSITGKSLEQVAASTTKNAGILFGFDS